MDGYRTTTLVSLHFWLRFWAERIGTGSQKLEEFLALRRTGLGANAETEER